MAGLDPPHASPGRSAGRAQGQHRAAGRPSGDPAGPSRSGGTPVESYLRGSAPPAGLLPPPCRGSWLALLAVPAADTTTARGQHRPCGTSSRSRPGRARPVPARPAHLQPADGLAVLPPQQRQLLPQLQDTTHSASTAPPRPPDRARRLPPSPAPSPSRRH